jgi:hypothetical protein
MHEYLNDQLARLVRRRPDTGAVTGLPTSTSGPPKSLLRLLGRSTDGQRLADLPFETFLRAV